MFKNQKKKGFTLIELLIVVAIIAILAAIAIPQFAQYRIKGYNAAASSDIRNAKTAEEALFADFQSYGDTNGVQLLVSKTPITTTDNNGNPRSIDTGLSSGVGVLATTDAGAAGGRGGSYVAFTKHKQGDRMFSADSDATTIYWEPRPANADLQDPAYPSTINVVDITAGGTATAL